MKTIAAACALFAGTMATCVTAQVPAEAWQIGPVIRGTNYSIGMPRSMERVPDGASFDFPQAGRGSVHYVSLATGPLQGARSITVRYRIDARSGVRFVAQESQAQGKFGLAIHRAGDNWSARGRYEAYRWYSPSIVPLETGVHTFTVRLDDPSWGAVMTSTAASNPQAFAGTLANTESVSMTFGGEGGRGHGVYSTGPARFTLLDFRID